MRCNLPATHVSGNGFRTCQTHTDLGYGNRTNIEPINVPGALRRRVSLPPGARIEKQRQGTEFFEPVSGVFRIMAPEVTTAGRCDVPCYQSVVQVLAAAIGARRRCAEPCPDCAGRDHLRVTVCGRCDDRKIQNPEWFDRWTARIQELTDLLPHGSGIDRYPVIDLDKSSESRIVIDLGFHHMDDLGSYAGWSNYTVIVTPAFEGIAIRITGRDRNQVKDYLYESFDHALGQPAPDHLQRTGVRPVPEVQS